MKTKSHLGDMSQRSDFISGKLLPHQSVSATTHRLDIARLARVGFDLGAEPANQALDTSVIHFVDLDRAPHTIDHLVLVDNFVVPAVQQEK